jgi:DNA (cytosine-5)-methyltransferase 1
MIGREEKNGPQGDGINEEVAFTLNTVDRHAVAVRTANTNANGIGVTDEVAYTVDCGNGQAVAYGMDLTQRAEGIGFAEEKAACLCGASQHGGSGMNVLVRDGAGVYAIDRGSFRSGEGMNRPPYINEDGINSTLTTSGPGAVAVEPTYLVRRLTPLECERLQGFPDFWTDTVFKGKPASDCARYKALGNSVAEVCVEYVAEGIAEIMPHAIGGSLFDGIAGFPLAFAWKGIPFIWASEIEEFCVALTQDRMDSVGKQLAMIKIRGY